MGFNLLKIFCVLLIVQSTLTGCISFINTEKSEESTSIPIPHLIEKDYIKSTKVAGFTYRTPDIYTTRWVLNIYDLYDWKIENKDSVIEWTNSISVAEVLEFSKRDENHILDYVNLKNDLGLDFKESEKVSLMESVYENTTENSINSRFQISNLLELDVEDKDEMEIYVKNKIKNSTNESDRVNYYYLLMQLDKSDTLMKEENIVQLDTPISDNSLDAYDIHSLYNEMKIKEEKNISFEHSIAEEEVHKLINKFVEFESDMTPQTLYKLLYIAKDVTNSKDIKKLEEFFAAISLENGWFILNETLGIIPTYYGLITTDYISNLNYLDKDLISNYLNEELKRIIKKKNLSSSDTVQLKYILSALSILNDSQNMEKATNLIQHNITEITEIKNLEEENVKAILLLMETSIVEGVKGISINQSVLNTINESIKELREVDRIYYSIVLSEYINEETKNTDEIKTKLERFQKENGSFKSSELSDSISDSQIVIKTYSLMNEKLPNEEKVVAFLKEELDKVNDNPSNIIQKGLICESLTLIES